MPFELIRSDITTMKVDAIVNAANRSLLGGGGVDGAIHEAAGPKLLEECRKLGGCETGEAKITRGYDLPARYVIHTVGPIWQGGGDGEAGLLEACYRNSLELALKYRCRSVAFPLISAGAYGYPKEEALNIAVETIRRFLDRHDMSVYLVIFGRTEFLTGKKLFRDVQEYIDDIYAGSHIRPNVEQARETLWHRDEAAALDMDVELASAPMPCERPKPAGSAEPKMSYASRPEREPVREKKRRLMSLGSLEDLLKRTDEGFSVSLLRLIDEKGLTDAQCYKRANVDRKLFSKIRSNPSYKPSKPTVFAFAVALELTLPETVDLLRRAGFALSHSSKFDIILEYFLKERNYDIYAINEVLFQYDMPLLGSSAN